MVLERRLRICLVNAYPLKEMGIVGQIYPPLGILYLASYARSIFDNLEIRVMDGYREKGKNILETICHFNPDLVGISFTTPSSTGAYELITHIKKALGKEVIVISGGAHPSISAEEPLVRSLTDYVVRGEGEIVFSEIIKCLIAGRKENIRKVESVSYMYDGKVIDNPLMPLIKDLDVLPFPARDLLDIKRYPGYHYKKRCQDTSIISGRGCPFQCVYCSNPVWRLQKPWYRLRTPGNVVDEMEWIKEQYGITEIYDQTDEFNTDLKWAKAVCDVLIKRDLGIAWKVQMRADLIDEELAEKMSKAGCWLALFGIETGNDETSVGIKKNILVEQSVQTLQMMKKKKIKTLALLMAFNVWEERGLLKFEDKEKTLCTLAFAKDLAKRNLVDLVAWSLTTPYPGSELYHIAQRHQLIPEEFIGKWEYWDSSAHFIMKLPGVTGKDWVDIQRKGKLLQTKLLIRSGTLNVASIPVYLKKLTRLIRT